ncbi:transcriptional regulator [Streptomyces viridochromogenes DSM 40736]|uniref:Transcriptional regulator n=1 Tax=Streptomyces viridochromogenes (strain DSM 40736 / JCM 4977 / BCRC 1201 / Tue 494) TaxID=591159 RepID=D9XDK6_STRVT|nr:BTAD domain-containing putative transcriptional regulator [Streptomyces viridochromogenes]EFL30385.1 transcriptional regulator [Streptomyces viridochromogenes DSM 40736]
MDRSEACPAPRLRLLGRFGLVCGGEAVELSGNAQRLLALVGLRSSLSRTLLAGTLWPEATEAHARGSLRSTLCKLPHGDRALVTCGRNAISLADPVTVDARELAETALRLVRPSGAPGDEPVPTVLFGEGELLPGWDDDWASLERERLRHLRLHALEALAYRLAGEGRPALALETALTSVRGEPLRESAHRAVVAAYLAQGKANEAVRHYRAFRRALREELGVAPSPQFTRMLAPEDGLRSDDAGVTHGPYGA